jgi:hypothetical protein
VTRPIVDRPPMGTKAASRMPPLWPGVVGLAITIGAWFVVMPWARRHDRRVADRREATGRSRLVIPNWAFALLVLSLLAISALLYDLR